ncbi:MAG TPA: response regulator transcription factor [Candidatus Fraserbacteria bacterium]|nr:response regulator transcription factor [Candidatus Fraserbacteria bacterium]
MTQMILVVDDEEWVVKLVRGYLQQAGYRVACAGDGEQALLRFQEVQPALVVLDLMLPKLDGLEVARRLRATSQVPIIMLTAKVSESDRVAGLELGADDYLVKPFSPRELVSRVRAVLRRSLGSAKKPQRLERGELLIDIERHQASLGGQPLTLTPTEFRLLTTLAEHPGRVFSRLQLLQRLQGSTYESFERTIDAHVKNLRRKLSRSPEDPQYIITVYGVGYRFRG